MNEFEVMKLIEIAIKPLKQRMNELEKENNDLEERVKELEDLMFEWEEDTPQDFYP